MQCLWVATLLCIIPSVYNAVMINRNPCPKTFRIGDKWRPFTEHCTECICTGTGYQCSSCGAFALYTEPDCYIEKAPTSAPYPKCCEQYKICIGNKEFNATKYKEYTENFGYRYY